MPRDTLLRVNWMFAAFSLNQVRSLIPDGPIRLVVTEINSCSFKIIKNVLRGNWEAHRITKRTRKYFQKYSLIICPNLAHRPCSK